MPGAGSSPAGLGPAGADPIVRSPAAVPAHQGAQRFEGSTQDWVLDTDYQFVTLHPVEQGVALSMMVQRGKLKAAPRVGNTLFEIEYLGGDDLGADVDQRVRDAYPLSDLVAAGDVEIVRIEYSTEGPGLATALYFKNLRIDKHKELRRASR